MVLEVDVSGKWTEEQDEKLKNNFEMFGNSSTVFDMMSIMMDYLKDPEEIAYRLFQLHLIDQARLMKDFPSFQFPLDSASPQMGTARSVVSKLVIGKATKVLEWARIKLKDAQLSREEGNDLPIQVHTNEKESSQLCELMAAFGFEKLKEREGWTISPAVSSLLLKSYVQLILDQEEKSAKKLKASSKPKSSGKGEDKSQMKLTAFLLPADNGVRVLSCPKNVVAPPPSTAELEKNATKQKAPRKRMRYRVDEWNEEEVDDLDSIFGDGNSNGCSKKRKLDPVEETVESLELPVEDSDPWIGLYDKLVEDLKK